MSIFMPDISHTSDWSRDCFCSEGDGVAQVTNPGSGQVNRQGTEPDENPGSTSSSPASLGSLPSPLSATPCLTSPLLCSEPDTTISKPRACSPSSPNETRVTPRSLLANPPFACDASPLGSGDHLLQYLPGHPLAPRDEVVVTSADLKSPTPISPSNLLTKNISTAIQGWSNGLFTCKFLMFYYKINFKY